MMRGLFAGSHDRLHPTAQTLNQKSVRKAFMDAELPLLSLIL